MLDNLGLSKEEIDAILRKGIDGPIKIDADTVRNVISEAITANNKKVLEQIRELFLTK